jgi:hypothetical protein
LRLERPYYHCAACGNSQIPGVELLRFDGPVTVGAAEVISMAGILESFAKGAEKTLAKISGLRVSESTVERITEAAGQQRAAELASPQPGSQSYRPWRWQRDAEGKRCAYLSIDHTGVRQQGPGGVKAEGRMVAVGMIYNAGSEHDPDVPPSHQVRYLAGFYELDELGCQLHAQAMEVGWHLAERRIALTDGGNGLEGLIKRHFPLCECILDFWHASEYVAELARALHPTNEDAFAHLQQQWCHLLKHEGGAGLLRHLESCDQQDWSPSAREAYTDLTRYLRNNVHRMDYPTYLARGWQIGSGPVEAACKTVIAQRLKGSGMRWGEDGANAVSHLRALYLSEPSQWDVFWKSYPNKPHLQN